jgi:hypothetical protein
VRPAGLKLSLSEIRAPIRFNNKSVDTASRIRTMVDVRPPSPCPCGKKNSVLRLQSTEPQRTAAFRERKRRTNHEAGTDRWGEMPAIAAQFDALEQFGEMIGEASWRRERDSNPRYGFPYTHFPGVRLQPLGHLSSTRHGLIRPHAFAKRLSGPDRAFPQVSGDICESARPAASCRGWPKVNSLARKRPGLPLPGPWLPCEPWGHGQRPNIM